jgi:photosystem II stability/assembly factor-like uncharacterized protein
MRFLLLLSLVATAAAQSGPQVQTSHTTENLRGVSSVSRRVAWASGTHGTYLRTTDGGQTWIPAQVPDASALDFRAVVAFSADEAFLMSAGPGDQSRIYHTSDAGQHWQLQFTNTNPKGFFDSMAFWDEKHGIVLGDPIPDEKGKLRFELLVTQDGQSWQTIPPSQLPEALEGEGAFAASNSCIAILPTHSVLQSESSTPVILSGAVAQAKREQLRSRRIPIVLTSFAVRKEILSNASDFGDAVEERLFSAASGAVEERLFSAASGAEEKGPSAPVADDPNIWFATGGKVARVFRSADRGKTWEVFNTPTLHGPESAGIFSIAFRDALHGVIAGGDYKHPNDDGPNLAFTEDGGKTWTLSSLHPQAYFSAVTYDRQVNAAALRQQTEEKSATGIGKKLARPVAPQRIFLVGEDFIFDFRPPNNPRRINGKKKQGFAFNAVSPFPEGGALVVGPKGTIAYIP